MEIQTGLKVQHSFKLISLELFNHPFLGDLKLNFTDTEELNNGPYTTVIIGPNGTGKSEILRILVDIFREIEANKNQNNRVNFTDAKYSLTYLLNGKKYTYSNLNSIRQKDAFQNDFTISNLPLPNKLIAHSFLLNDKFPFVTSAEGDLYKYIGVRRSSQVAGTRDLIKRVVKDFGRIVELPEFQTQIYELLDFLGYEKKLWISYYPRYKHIFYTGNLTLALFKDFFKNNSNYINRKTEPWSISRYKKIEEDTKLNQRIVDYLNSMSGELEDVSKRSQAYYYDILNKKEVRKDFEILSHLYSLDLISYPGIEVEKIIKNEEEIKTVNYDIQSGSSGEYHILLSFLSILSSIEEKSLILLDEPDISLHPNWQMKYITFLKKVFKDYSNCHFIICTHSHFFVSDLQPATSKIIALKMDDQRKISIRESTSKNTFAWSAEEVLLEVFNVPTTRNYFIYEKVGEILDLIALRDTEQSKILPQNIAFTISTKIEALQDMGIENLSQEDPLKEIIDKIILKYGRSN